MQEQAVLREVFRYLNRTWSRHDESYEIVDGLMAEFGLNAKTARVVVKVWKKRNRGSKNES